jgi:hypothetical protein
MAEEIKAAVAAVEQINRAFEEFKQTHDANQQKHDALLEEKLKRI